MTAEQPCPICGFASRPGGTIVPNSLGRQRMFRHCQGCDHLWVDPMPDVAEVATYYRTRATMMGGAYPATYLRKKLSRFQSVLDAHGCHASNVILEIGPGPIGMTDLVVPGCRYVGIEPSEEYRAALTERLSQRGVECNCYETVSDIPAAVQPDLFFSNAAFEHLVNPREVFLAATQLMPTGGIVVLGIPDRCVELPDAPLVISGAYSSRDFHSTHLHSFSEQSVLSLFGQAGVERIGTHHALRPGLARACRQLHDVLEEGLATARVTSAWWLARYARAMFVHRLARWLIDPRPSGDDRCEAIYVGVKK